MRLGVDELVNWCGCGGVSLWVCKLIGWWADWLMSLWGRAFVSWAVCELMNWWADELMRLWGCEFVSLQVDWLMSWIVDEFLRLQFDEFMSLPVAGFSRVHKPTSWFALHFIYERGVYLVLVTQRQQASTICLLPWGWPSSVTPFFYIKPQRGDKTTIQPKVVLYRFSTSNHN